MSFSNIIAFIGYIVYNYLSGTIFTPKNNTYWIVGIIMGVLSIGLIGYGNYYETMNWKVFFIFSIIRFRLYF